MAGSRRQHALGWMVAVLAVGCLAGCSAQLDRIESSIGENSDDIAMLRAENRRLSQEVKALAELLRLETTSGVETNAQRFAKLGQVSMRLDQLLQKLDDNAAYMRDLSARVDLLVTRSGVPTIGEYTPPPPDTQQGLAELPEEGRSIFQAAQLDRNRGNLEMACEGFRDFLNRFADSELGDDARYWLGDIAFGADDWQDAADHFERVLLDHPESTWAPSVLFKRSYCLRELGRPDEAEAALDDLRTRFPDSNEAALVSRSVE